MSRIFRYVLVSDSGMAPHRWDGVISLATCKVKVREQAKIGDWVLGNRSAPHNLLVAWAGRVADVVPTGDYGIRFSNRLDALYPMGADGKPERDLSKLPWYHPDEKDRNKDCRGNALLFDPRRTWYFGADARLLPPHLEHLAHKGIAHSNQTDPCDIPSLIDWLEGEATPGFIGKPRDPWPGPGASPFDGKDGKPRRGC